MDELLQKRLKIEKKRGEMYSAYVTGDSGTLLKISQELDRELNDYEQLLAPYRLAAGIRRYN